MSDIIEFVLPGLPPINTADGPSRWARYRVKKAWMTRTILAARDAGGRALPAPLARASVTIIRSSAREPDFDGLVQGGKFILDGLVKAGVLVDDSPKVIGRPDYRWERAPRGMGSVRVRVEGVAA